MASRSRPSKRKSLNKHQKQYCAELREKIADLELKIKMLGWVVRDDYSFSSYDRDNELERAYSHIYSKLVVKQHELWMRYLVVAQLFNDEEDIRAKKIALRGLLKGEKDRDGYFSPEQVARLLDVPRVLASSSYSTDNTKDVLESIIEEGEELEFIAALKTRQAQKAEALSAKEEAEDEHE